MRTASPIGAPWKNFYHAATKITKRRATYRAFRPRKHLKRSWKAQLASIRQEPLRVLRCFVFNNPKQRRSPDDDFARMKRFREAGWRVALEATQSHDGFERVRREPRLATLGAEEFHQQVG